MRRRRRNARIETAKALGVPKEKKLSLGGKVDMKFVLIPAGVYKDDDGHDVTVNKPFYLGKFVVVPGAVSGRDAREPEQAPGPLNPVDSVDWAPATQFSHEGLGEVEGVGPPAPRSRVGMGLPGGNCNSRLLGRRHGRTRRLLLVAR